MTDDFWMVWNVNISISEHSKLIEFAANDIAWTFIGPDDALVAGIRMILTKLVSKPLVRQDWQRSWRSKDFAKEIMVIRRSDSSLWHIFRFRGGQGLYRGERRSYRCQGGWIGARGKRCCRSWNGWASGRSRSWDALDNKFGDLRVWLLRNSSTEKSSSLLLFVNGDKFYIMPTAQDHKRLRCMTRVLTRAVREHMHQFHTYKEWLPAWPMGHCQAKSWWVKAHENETKTAVPSCFTEDISG